MKYRKGIFAIVYKKKNDKILFLILHRIKHWTGWEFVKGGIDKGETEVETVRREVKEESGLKIKKIENCHIKGKYKYPRELADRKGFIGQTYSVFLVEVLDGKVKFDKHEHSGFKWLEYENAIKKITKSNQKDALRKVVSRVK